MDGLPVPRFLELKFVLGTVSAPCDVPGRVKYLQMAFSCLSYLYYLICHYPGPASPHFLHNCGLVGPEYPHPGADLMEV